MSEHYENAKLDASYANQRIDAAKADTRESIKMAIMLLGSIAQRLGTIADCLEWQVGNQIQKDNSL